MVANGYILPKNNLQIRADNLKLGLALQNKKNLFSQLRFNPEVLNVASSQTMGITKNALSDKFNDLSNLSQEVKDAQQIALYNEVDKISLQRKISNTSDISNTFSIPSGVKSTVERVIDSAIKSATDIKGSPLTELEISDIKSDISKKGSIISQLSSKKSNTPSNTPSNASSEIISPSQAPTMASDWTELSLDSNDLSKVQKNYIELKNDLMKNVNNLEQYKAVIGKHKSKLFDGIGTNRKVKIPLSNDRKNSVSIDSKGQSYTDKINKSFDYFKSNPKEFIELLDRSAKELAGNGLKGGNLHFANGKKRNVYLNFGRLRISEDGLKKNNLTIYNPSSKDSVLSKRNISPELKKVILDIKKTLEFDERDYHELEADEKVVVEKIIRLQKNMKEVNFKKIIDEDDRKLKKRLEILVGEINAGNNSSINREEMKNIVKSLYYNKAISKPKYIDSVKSINNLVNSI